MPFKRAIKQRAKLRLGLCESKEEFAELIQFHTGKRDGKELTGKDYAKVAAHVRALEQERDEDERVVAAEEAEDLGAAEAEAARAAEVEPARVVSADAADVATDPDALKQPPKRLPAKAGVH